jgi:hypothetical protein
MNEVMLALGFFVVALLYASVGHGGATGYLALLALVMPTLPHHEAATVEEARQIVLQAATPLGIEWVSLPEAVGRVLAEPVIAPHDLPPFDNAAMDGYAIRAADAPLGCRCASWVRRMRWCQKWRDGCNRCMHFIGARSPLAWQNFFLQASAT